MDEQTATVTAAIRGTAAFPGLDDLPDGETARVLVGGHLLDAATVTVTKVGWAHAHATESGDPTSGTKVAGPVMIEFEAIFDSTANGIGPAS